MVTDQQPTKVGQRVQEVFSDTRGWVTKLWTNEDGVPVADVEWDEPSDLDEDGFPIEALRVVEVIRIDADIFQDPSLWDQVEQTTTGTEHGIVYKLKNGMRFKGIDHVRSFMLGYFTRS